MLTEAPEVSRNGHLDTVDTISTDIVITELGKINADAPTTTSEVGDSNSFTMSWDSVDDQSTGMTQWGTYVDFDTSGDQNTLSMNAPEEQFLFEFTVIGSNE